ncbi:MAG: DNA polymerase III subunit gamma/tau, partial [Candidatus Sericytochromatia bacterium]|nr:DNA polymerase III subunit gamma/tau [Candidatus Tanganyikabacteria bacterium]
MYQALYRKYRPQTFKELAGQDPIAETLRNEIRDGRLAHAYLFTGPRGTGKTTSARLLAKALNCEHGPTPDPCAEDAQDAPECRQCKAIRGGTHLDVVEIDAASNRGIDDIRSLQERVQLAPVQGRYKVFIIDEVHMLTDPAWNALLKTLEEPPPRCIFVMATTEVHKVLATVLSRCQRFDFQRIARPALLARLRLVADRENIEIDDAALDVLARRAEGGLRDALSLLDQVAATARRIDADAVYEALGLLPADQILALGEALATRDAVAALDTAYGLLAAGHDHRIILRELLGWARNLLLLQLAPDKAQALDIPAAQAPLLAAQLPHFTQADLLAALEILRETDQALRGSNQQTVWLEVGLLRLCDRTSVASLADLTARVAALEARSHGGSPPAPAPAGRAAPPVHAPPPVRTAQGAPPAPGSPAPAPARPAPAPTAPGNPPPATPPPPPAAAAPPGEGGSYEAALAQQAAGDRDVFHDLLASYQATGLNSKIAAFKTYVLTARRRSDGGVEVRTKSAAFFKEGGEHRKFLLERIREMWGPDSRLEVIEDPGATRRAAATPPAVPARPQNGHAAAPPASGPQASQVALPQPGQPQAGPAATPQAGPAATP